MKNNIKNNIDDKNSCTSLVIKKGLTNVQSLILYLYMYSFLGWVLETIYAFIVLGRFSKRGFLFGPVCPIYGYGAIMMILFISKYKDNIFKNFFASAIIFSIFEYLVGFFLEALVKIRVWDYTNDFLNINGRISIMYTFFWGIAGILFIKHIHPFIKSKTEYLLNKLNLNLQKWILYVLTFILVSDTILSCIKYLNLF